MTFGYNADKQLTEHFNCKEFRCKCNKQHEYTIIVNLVEKLEELYKRLTTTKFGCSAIRINSGYRCTEHDIAVKGTGTGQHTKGYAADIICFDKNKTAIPSKYICCVAQDIGFPAIAKIDDTAVHVDVRMFGGWYGDETVTTTYSVTQDFYDYFDLGKNDIYGGDITTNVVVYKISDCKSIVITGDEIRIEPKNGTVK